MDISCSKSALKAIGKKLRHGEPLSDEEEAWFSEFRLGHRKIIEQFRQRAHLYLKGNNQLFASRIKKRQTIISKLQDRFSQMDLTRMQDIAGCRIFFSSIKDLKSFRSIFVKARFAERITDDNQYDYIARPNPKTGYRGIHDVFQEKSNGTSGEIRAKIEIQYRTWVQHAWSTALEIWDNYNLKGAKFGREEPEIQLFFQLVSELFWRYLDSDGSHPVLDSSPRQLFSDILRLDRQYGIINKYLGIYKSAKLQKPPTKIKILPHQPQPLVLQRPISTESTSSDNRGLIVETSEWNDLEEKLFKNEREKTGFDFVFVFTEQYARTYNNYLNNPEKFLRFLRKALDACRKDASSIFGAPHRFYESLDMLK